MKHDHLARGGRLEARPRTDTVRVWGLAHAEEGLLVRWFPHQIDGQVPQPRTVVGIEVSVAGCEGGNRLDAVRVVVQVGPQSAVLVAECRDRLADIRACLGHIDVSLVEIQETLAFGSVSSEAEAASDLLFFPDASRQLAPGAVDDGIEVGDRRGNCVELHRRNSRSD